jgi:biotin transport system substrate-specific component
MMVPVSLQTLVVLLSGLLLGPRLGAPRRRLYLMAGASGLPVFAGGLGVAYLFGPTGGYLLAFPVAACVAGHVAAQPAAAGLADVLLAAAAVAATLTVYAGGWAQLAALTGDAGAALRLGVLPFLVGDVAKVVVAVILAGRLRRRVLACSSGSWGTGRTDERPVGRRLAGRARAHPGLRRPDDGPGIPLMALWSLLGCRSPALDGYAATGPLAAALAAGAILLHHAGRPARRRAGHRVSRETAGTWASAGHWRGGPGRGRRSAAPERRPALRRGAGHVTAPGWLACSARRRVRGRGADGGGDLPRLPVPGAGARGGAGAGRGGHIGALRGRRTGGTRRWRVRPGQHISSRADAAAAYLRTLSLWFATALHIGWNWATASLFDLPVSGITDFRHAALRARGARAGLVVGRRVRPGGRAGWDHRVRWRCCWCCGSAP